MYGIKLSPRISKCSFSELLRNGLVVPVQLSKEPDNEYDSQAIAFQCQLESHWRRIGYVVKEALPAVHDALNKKKIVSINFTLALRFRYGTAEVLR